MRYAAVFMDTSREDQEEFDTEYVCGVVNLNSTHWQLLYSYPTSSIVIQRLKGLLVALNGVNRAVTGQAAQVASLQHYDDEDFKIKAAYSILHNTIFVLILPSYIDDSVILHLVHDQLSLLRFLFGSVGMKLMLFSERLLMCMWLEEMVRGDLLSVRAEFDPIFEAFFNDVFAGMNSTVYW